MTEQLTFPYGCIRVLDKGFVALIEHMGTDNTIVRAARVSYGPGTHKTSDDRNLIRYLMRNRHTSPFEMVEFIFCLRLPIFVSNQLVRHRTASLNQMSGRYSVMPDVFYVPEETSVTKQNPSNKQGGTDEYVKFAEMPNEAIEHYTELDYKDDVASLFSWAKEFRQSQEASRVEYEGYIKSGMRRELARINLPLSQYTEMYWKMDLHNLFHFLKLRLDHHAQYEIRVYAEAIYKLMRATVPLACEAFEDYVLNSLTLSAKDIEGLRGMLPPDAEGETLKAAETIFENKRERGEFAEKVRKIRGDS